MVQRIAMIGAGSMSEAIISGMVKRGFLPSDHIVVTNKSNEDRLKLLHRTYGITYLQTEKNSIKTADIIILSVKPKDVPAALKSIKSEIKEDQLIISVVAGISSDYIVEQIGQDNAVIRAMPNTSALIGYSATAISKGTYATADHIEITKTLFNTIGITVEVNEEDMDVVTGVSGSGPAYIYYLVEAMETEAVKLGLDKEVARSLIIQTIIGAGQMLAQSGDTAQTLRKKVTSPNGTTEAGINMLESLGFQTAIQACVKSAANRAVELGKR